jgi:putative glutamine amidotransferase
VDGRVEVSWLYRLLSADAPEHTTLQAAGLSFRGLFPGWVAVLVLAATAAGLFWLYARERARLNPLRRSVLALLRTATVGLVLLLLLRPVLVASFGGERPRGVVLLIDNSQSMTLQDRRLTPLDRSRVDVAEGRLAPDAAIPPVLTYDTTPEPHEPSRAELVRAVLTNPRLDLLKALQRRGPLRPYLFGQRLQSAAAETPDGTPANPLDRLLASFQADEGRTALADSINELLAHSGGELPAAVVVMTDGQDNASKLTLEEVARECGRLQVPLHIYGVGSSEGGSLLIKDVAVPETIFAEDTVAVPVRWRSRGFTEGTVTFTLMLAGQVVARREVPVREGDDLRQVLTFTPDKAGSERRELTVTVRLAGHEEVGDSVRRSVRVVDQKVRILYVENAPRWEYKFLQPALLRDRRVEARFILLNGDPQVLQGGPPFLEKFPDTFPEFESDHQRKPFDLLILGDVPAAFFGVEKLRRIRDYVKEGGGLVLIAGREHAPAEYAETPLAEVLPVEFLALKPKVEPDARPQPFHPVLTAAGQHSDMLALADTPEENVKVWKELPGLYWHYPVTKLRPGATSLLTHPKQKAGPRDMPIVATQYYGKGQVLFVGTDETWRWRYNAGDRYVARFWGQVVYQMSLPHLLGGSNRTQLALDRSDALLGRPGYVYARLLDANYQPLKASSVPARLEFLDATDESKRFQTIELRALARQPGQLRAALANDVPGRFALHVDKGDHVEAGLLEYRVSLPPWHELEAVGMAEEALREAARLSGGRFYREEDLHRLAAAVTPRKTAFVQRQEVLLWNPLALLLFVGLVTAEWVVRKFSHLS